MKIYPDPEKWAERMKSIPRPLRQKALDELDAAYEKAGFRAVGNGKDRNGNFINVEIKPGTDLQKVYSFLETVEAGAVSIESHDIEPMFGKNVATLGVKRYLESSDDKTLDVISRDEIADKIVEVRRNVTNIGGAIFHDAEFIENDLVSNGYLTQEDIDANERWSQPSVEEWNSSAPELPDDFKPDPVYSEWDEESI